MPIRSSIFIFLALFAGTAFGQAGEKETSVIATITDSSGLPIAGVSLFVENADSKVAYGSATDISGRVELRLRPGISQITANNTIDPVFKLYLAIPGSGPMPNNLQIVLDPKLHCCATPEGKPFPHPLSLPKPPYPPAARAVRASGEVVVKVDIDETGSVTRSTALTGHPLLRAASAVAANGSKFEVQTSTVRSLVLTYAYFFDDERVVNLQRHANPYRIEITADYARLHTMNSH